MSRKVMIGGEEKGDWFDAVISWAAKPAAPTSPAAAPAKAQRLPKEEVKKAARAIKTREQPMPASGPSEPHIVVAPAPPVHVAPAVHVLETETTEEPPARTTPSRDLGYHSCGHLSWASPEQDEAARAEGKCCGNWKQLPSWSVRGLYTPVPVNQRRTVEKERSAGWPGLCCDPVTNLYIGGVGNDCRYRDGGKVRCVVHAVPLVPPEAGRGEGAGGGGEGDGESPKRVTSPRTRKKEPA